jgi:hypothetical protein
MDRERVLVLFDRVIWLAIAFLLYGVLMLGWVPELQMIDSSERELWFYIAIAIVLLSKKKW